MKEAPLPETLPERPLGWTRQLSVHFNFGRGKGAASYVFRDEHGTEMPIGYQYDTRPGGLAGFFLIGREKNSPPMSWPDLRKWWPRFLEKRREK